MLIVTASGVYIYIYIYNKGKSSVIQKIVPILHFSKCISSISTGLKIV